VDVIGSIGAAGTRDKDGRRINDPFPTPFPAGGFDLDAVGVIHAAPANVSPATAFAGLTIYPNPAGEELVLALPPQSGVCRVSVYDIAGRHALQLNGQSGSLHIPLKSLAPGSYFITIQSDKGATCTRAFLHR
jgi:hypothetical protein